MRSKSLSFTSKTVRREAEHAQAAIGETRTGRSGEKHPDCAGGHPERRKTQSRKWENVPEPQAINLGVLFSPRGPTPPMAFIFYIFHMVILLGYTLYLI